MMLRIVVQESISAQLYSAAFGASFADAVANPSLAGINLSGGKSDVSRAQHEERTAFIWGCE